MGFICSCVRDSITDPPNVSLAMGRSLDAQGIKAGDDVYFDCHVDARPSASRIEWKRNVSLLLLYFFPLFFQIFEYPIERKKEEEEENVFDDFVRIRFNRASNLCTTCRPTLSSPIRASFYRTSVVTWPEIFRAPPPTSREMPRAIRSH